MTGKLQIEMKFPDLYTTFRCPDLIQFVSFFPNLIAIKCRLFFFSSSWTFCALVEQVVGLSCCTTADYRIHVSFKAGMWSLSILPLKMWKTWTLCAFFLFLFCSQCEKALLLSYCQSWNCTVLLLYVVYESVSDVVCIPAIKRLSVRIESRLLSTSQHC